MKKIISFLLTLFILSNCMMGLVLADNSGIELPMDSFDKPSEGTEDSADDQQTPGGEQQNTADTAVAFTDVPTDAWYKQYVDYACEHNIFAGTSKTAFSPLSKLTRAQFVQVIANIESVKLDNSIDSPFDDVLSGKWYTAAVTWGYKNGIVSGVGAGKYQPDREVTREEMCVMLVNYTEKYKKVSLGPDSSSALFSDHSDISDWAKAAVYKCRNSGIVSGVGNNMFSPRSTADRAQGAAVFTNYYKNYI